MNKSERFRLQDLNHVNLDTLYRIIHLEHPQTVALILSHLEPKKRGQLLKKFDKTHQTLLLNQIARLKPVQEEHILLIEEQVSNQLEEKDFMRSFKEEGLKKISGYLMEIESSSREKILNELDEKNHEITEKIKSQMFTFEDLVKLDDQQIAELMKQIPLKDWVIALKIAPQPLIEKIFKNLSKNAAAMLKEDLALAPKIKKSDMEQLQKKIANLAQSLFF